MESYLYTAVNNEGKKVRGEKRAEDVVHLYSLLNNEGLYCLNAHRKAQWENQAVKPKNQELSLMCKQLSAMLSSGIPLVNALEMLRQKSDKKKMKKLYAQLVEEVRKGSSLTLAMKQCQQAFPPLLIYLVQAGEMNGTLDSVMERMAGHYDKEYKLRNKVTSALIYPIMLLVVTVAVILALMTSVVPSFLSMVGAMELPWNTLLLISMSNFIVAYWPFLLLGVLVAILGFRMALKVPAIRRGFDEIKVKFPVFGTLNRIVATSRFARTFSSLYSSGISVIDSLQVSGDVLNNSYFTEKVNWICERVRRGEMLSRSIEASEAFDPLLNSMMYVGEESGSLEEVLNSISDYYDTEADNATQKMVALMEPIMIVILAIIIFFVIISIIMPIYDSYGMIA